MSVRYFKAGPAGWSQWLSWSENTRFSCCACGLTHNTQVKLKRRRGRNGINYFRLYVRMRFNKRATAERRRMRRHKGLVVPCP
jgi:hypothetical protein